MDKSTIIELVLFGLIVYTPVIYSYSTVVYAYDNPEWREYAENTVGQYVNENYPVKNAREISRDTGLTYLQAVYVMYHMTVDGEIRRINNSYYPYIFNTSGLLQREPIAQESIQTGFQRR